MSRHYFPGLLFVESTFPVFCISGKLFGCRVSKPYIPSLVGKIVRQQDLRCPFLVISGGNECYHNPLTLSFPRSLPVPCQPCKKPLCSLAQNFYTTLFCPSCSPSSISSIPLPFVLTGLFSACCSVSPPLLSSLWPALWSYCGLALGAADWTVRDDVQGKPQLIRSTQDREAVVLH